MKKTIYSIAAALGLALFGQESKASTWVDDFLCEDCVIELPTNDYDALEHLSDFFAMLVKPKTVNALVYDYSTWGSVPVGTATIKLGKLNKKKQTSKMTLKVSLFTGKRYTASTTVSFADGNEVTGEIEFKSPKNNPLGKLSYALSYNPESEKFVDAFLAYKGSFSKDGDFTGTYAITTGSVLGGHKFGGELSGDEFGWNYGFLIDVTSEPDFGVGWSRIVDFPDYEPVYVRNGTKFAFDPAPTIKYVKYGSGMDAYYVLAGLDDPKKTNLSALKLTYAKNTGVFKGSFKVYASNAGSLAGKPKLKKYTAKVTGCIVDYFGYGAAVLKVGKTQYVYPVRLVPVTYIYE